MKTILTNILKLLSNIFGYLRQVGSEADGTGSSKRFIAIYVIFVLVSSIVFTHNFIEKEAAEGKIILNANAMTLIQFGGGYMMTTLLSFATVLLGIIGWAGVKTAQASSSNKEEAAQ